MTPEAAVGAAIKMAEDLKTDVWIVRDADGINVIPKPTNLTAAFPLILEIIKYDHPAEV